MKEDPKYRELMNYALRTLSRRAHTTHELHAKLQKRTHFTPAYGTKLIERLEELGLLSDKKFIQNTIEEAVHFRLQGPLKVASRLYKKGIPFKECRDAWLELGISEKELAREALKRASKPFHGLPKENLYQRRAQFLASRGFSSEIIYELAKPEDSL